MKKNKSILALVQEALANNPRLKACLDNIYIMVNDGAVILAGSVTHDSLKILAKGIVSSVPGVRLLIDDLRVEPVPQHRVGVQIDWAKGRMVLV